jgi:hypothetical protein
MDVRQMSSRDHRYCLKLAQGGEDTEPRANVDYAMDDVHRKPARALLVATRIWLPLAIAVAGVVAIAVGGGSGAVAAAGVVLLGVALIVWMINWMFRISLESNRDREREEAARAYFDRHGRWPEDE